MCVLIVIGMCVHTSIRCVFILVLDVCVWDLSLKIIVTWVLLLSYLLINNNLFTVVLYCNIYNIYIK